MNPCSKAKIRRSTTRPPRLRGGNGDNLMGEKEMDSMVPGDTTERQNMAVGNRRKSYSEEVIESVAMEAKVFAGESIVQNKLKIRGTTR